MNKMNKDTIHNVNYLKKLIVNFVFSLIIIFSHSLR